MRKMICLHGLAPEQEAGIRAAAPDWHLIFGRPKDLDPAEFRDAEVIFGWCDAAAETGLAAGSKLRWIQLWSSGADYMPFGKLKQREVMLTTASGVHPVPMAETVFAMLLAYTRELPRAIRNQRRRHWDKAGHFTELNGRTMAVIGLGSIGTEIARLAQAFGMRVIGVRRTGRPAEQVDAVLTLDKLDEALAASDVIVNVLPKTTETDGLFDEARFAAMKQGAFFVNIGRGASVCTDALVQALTNGHLAGAGLDVFETEPLPEDHPLWSLDNVIITPHTGGNTDRLKEKVTALFLENLAAYLETGSPARNLVDYGRQY
ncbi:D-2-hydroxyacid dehydrogenase [Paenibacillus thiaminolyticus]|nr:D-2-hydroxyacid dehydrogenase [Paenibacillus thiaminolyticus]